MGSGPHPTDWPLAGRSAVLTAIGTGLRSGGIVLAGPAGVGKTRLAQEALARARNDGQETEWLAATRDSAAIPFGTMIPLLTPEDPVGATPVELLRRTADRMAAHADRYPVVMIVDDAHLLDTWSATAVHQLTTRGLVSLLVTVRTGEPAPDAITALWKDGLVRRIQLRPLRAAAMDELLDHALGPHIEGVTRRWLHTLAAGNPLLLRELLIGAQEDDALVRREGVWILDRVPSRGTGLVELVEARLRSLDDAVRGVVEVVACGEPLPVAELDYLVDALPLPVEAVEAAERTGLIVAERVGRRRVLHMADPLHGEVLRGILPQTRARQVWGWLALAVAGQPQRRRDDLLRRARWQLEAGAATPSETLLEAARQAAEQVDLSLAARLVESAQNGEAAALVPDDGGWAAIHALSLYWGSMTSAGIEDPAISQPPPAGPASGDGVAADVLRAWALLNEGRCREALDTIPSDGDHPDGPARGHALPVAVLANAFLGQHDAAVASAETPPAPYGSDQVPVHWPTTLLDWSRCLALHLAGRLDDATLLAEQGYAAAVTHGAREVALGWAGFRGMVAKARGQVVTAQADLREAVAALNGRDAFQLTRHLLAELAGAAALAGDTVAAARWMARADELRDGGGKVLWDPWIELNRTWVIAAGGDVARAARQAQRAADLAGALEQYPVEAIALYDAARLGEARSVRPRLRRLTKTVDGPLVPTLNAAVNALADADGAALDQATSALGSLGYALHAAETAAEASRTHVAAGHPTSAAASRTHMMTFLDSCEAAGSPMLARPRDAPVTGLSRREREIVELAAAGLSSRIIAERLWLSVRTVDNHLGRAYTKLGVANRGELAALVGGSDDQAKAPGPPVERGPGAQGAGR